MEEIPLEQRLLVKAFHLFEMPKVLYLQYKPVSSGDGLHVEGTCGNSENSKGTHVFSYAFVGCVSALESTNVFATLQKVEQLILHT